MASVQAPLDPGYAALIATCKTPPFAKFTAGGGDGATIDSQGRLKTPVLLPAAPTS
jgi:hypothetical protein